MKYLLVLIFPVAVLFSYGCSSINAVSATSAGVKLLQAATVTDAQVASYSKQYVAALDKESTIAGPNDAYTQRINRLTSSFNGQNGINVKVYKTGEVNAFATADGSVRVYTGLMDLMNDQELLGVIGHELGHYFNHDSRDAFRTALLTSAARDGIASAGGFGATLSSSVIGDLGEALSSSQYSQKQEREADEYGYEFLKSHGINPWAMAMAFEKMLQMEKQSGSYNSSSLNQLFSTHPDLAARAKRMGEKATKDGYSRPSGTTTGTTTAVPVNNQSGSSTSEKWHF